jgi:hypothetical protein
MVAKGLQRIEAKAHPEQDADNRERHDHSGCRCWAGERGGEIPLRLP